MQAIGAAVSQAVDLALSVQETYANVTFETVDTFTMPLRDLIVDPDQMRHSECIESTSAEIVGEKLRFNSGICIKIIKNK